MTVKDLLSVISEQGEQTITLFDYFDLTILAKGRSECVKYKNKIVKNVTFSNRTNSYYVEVL